MGRSNDKKPGQATFHDASEASSAVFTQTHAEPLKREAPLGGPPRRDPPFLLDDEDPTKVVAGPVDQATEVAVPARGQTPKNAPKRQGAKTPRPRRRSKKKVDDGFADEAANVSAAVPIDDNDRKSLSGAHPVSVTQVGPSLLPFGRYHLVKRLAFGGMGEIWLAAQRAPGGFSKLVAIKRLLSHYHGDDTLTAMFFDEARLQALLSDRHIVQIYDMGEEDEHLYIAMEYVHGVSFKQILDRAKAAGSDVPLQFLCDLAVQTCRGFSYAHNVTDARGEPLSIVHRDVNPHNLLVSFGGEVKLIDFGIAKSEMSAGRTETGTIKGKFAYMSPEQSAAEALDCRSDIFSLGIVLYELISGENPFHRQNVVLSLEAIQRFTPPPVDTLRPEAAALAPIVNKALSKKAGERYSDTSELGEDLLRLLEGGAFERQNVSLSEWLHELFQPELQDHAAVLAENGLESGFVRRAPSGTSPGQVGGEISDYARRSPSGAIPAAPKAAPLPNVAANVQEGFGAELSGFDVEIFSGVKAISTAPNAPVPNGPPVAPSIPGAGPLPPSEAQIGELTSPRSIGDMIDSAIAPSDPSFDPDPAGLFAPTDDGVMMLSEDVVLLDEAGEANLDIAGAMTPVSASQAAAPAVSLTSTVPPDTSPTSPQAKAVAPPKKKKRSKLSLFLGASVGAFLTVSVGFALLWGLQPDTGPAVQEDPPSALPEAAPPKEPSSPPVEDDTPPDSSPTGSKATGSKATKSKATASKATASKTTGTTSSKTTGTGSKSSDDGSTGTQSATNETDPDKASKSGTEAKASTDKGTKTVSGDDKSTKTSRTGKGRTGRRGSRVGSKKPDAPDEPKVAPAVKQSVSVKTLKGSAVGAKSAALIVGKSKTFRAKNADGMAAEVVVTATDDGAKVTVKATPWAIVRVGSATKGRSPVKSLVVTRRAALSLRHPKHGEITMIISVAKH